MTGDQTENSKV